MERRVITSYSIHYTKLYDFIAALLADLKNKGADPQKKPEQVPLEAIIERFRNPSGTL